jgi:hypothetical protein
MKSRHVFGLTLAMIASISLPARGETSPQHQLAVSVVGGRNAVTFTSDEGAVTLHQTSNPVSNPRLVQVAGSPAKIATWNEQAAAMQDQPMLGAATSFYSVSLDGMNFSEPRATSYHVMLRFAGAQGFDPLAGAPVVPQALQLRFENIKADDATSMYIVQFIAPPTDLIAQPLRDLGAHTRAYLPEHSFIVEMTAQTAQQAAALPVVRWVGEFLPVYRLEEELLDELNGDMRQMPTRRYSIMLFERGAAAQQIVANRIGQLGGIVNARVPQGFRLEATLTPQQLTQIASMNLVEFIDRWGPAGTDMDIARQIGGAVPVLSGLGFTGQGVRGEVMDGGIRQTHQGFAGPPPLIHGQNPSIASHGTNTFGCVFGNGAANAAGTGMLPNREQGIFGTYNQLVSQGGSVSRYTHTAELVNPNGPYRAVFQSNSWGSSLTTQYNTFSAEMDDILFINDILICQSQSNAGSTSSRPEAWAKNIVSVGGVDHQNTLGKTDDSSSAASFGPATDGRVKPDLAHFYETVTCATSTSDTAYTTSFGGTSAATPIVCGHFGLVFQMWHQQVFSGLGGGATVFASRPHMSTAKALMINSAAKYNWLGGGANAGLTRARQGWGMPDLLKLYNDRNETFIVNETDPITPFSVNAYQFQVAAGAPEFRATMVYTDPKGTVGSPVARINDLSMKVTAPNGNFYWGNSGLTASNVSLANGTPNTVDPVENVFITNPAAGTWTIQIYGDAIVQDARLESPDLDADYALVVAGVVPAIPCPADVNGDDLVNANDLLAVIGAWGACAGCPADVNNDGSVNVTDLLTVIGAWGPCP